jgi:hypothetical protein
MRVPRQNKLPSLLRQDTSASQQLCTLLFRLNRQGASGTALAPERRVLALKHLSRCVCLPCLAAFAGGFLSLATAVPRLRPPSPPP